MLHAVDGQRPVRRCGPQQPLHPQDAVAMGVEQRRQPERECRPVQRPRDGQREGGHLGIMLRRVGQEWRRRGMQAFPPGEHVPEPERLVLDVEDTRVGGDGPHCGGEAGGRLGGAHVALGDHHRIGDGHLTARLRTLFKIAQACHRIHHRNHGGKAHMRLQPGVAREGRDDGSGVGEPRRFQDGAAEAAAGSGAVLGHAHQIVHRLGDIGAARAAEAPAVDQLHRLAGMHQQAMIDARLAELVDHEPGIAALRRLDEAADERRLARAEEPGHDDEGQALIHGPVSPARAR